MAFLHIGQKPGPPAAGIKPQVTEQGSARLLLMA
jgi:hypothetical protein